MTSKLKQHTGEAGELEKFPVFPPRDDMENSLHLDEPAHQAALREHLGNYDTTLILSEIPVRWTPNQTRGHRIPDLLVAFNVNRTLAVEQKGYSIRDQGKPPDLVLEVASDSTGDDDIGDKWRDYANFGIPEYWRFDPTGGQRHGAPIAGDRLVNGEYQPAEIIEVEPEHLHGYSDVLNLYPCSDHGELRWYDPVAGQHLMTFAEERRGRIAAEAQANAEHEARIAAEAQANAEQEARATAEARIRELEEKLQNRPEG